jgi:hypothetical protein
MNWAIGCTGTEEANAEPGQKHGPKLRSGIVDSPGVTVTPASLYLEQLRERLGAQAVANTGY